MVSAGMVEGREGEVRHGTEGRRWPLVVSHQRIHGESAIQWLGSERKKKRNKGRE
jgi:hypothetical protein